MKYTHLADMLSIELYQNALIYYIAVTYDLSSRILFTYIVSYLSGAQQVQVCTHKQTHSHKHIH